MKGKMIEKDTGKIGSLIGKIGNVWIEWKRKKNMGKNREKKMGSRMKIGMEFDRTILDPSFFLPPLQVLLDALSSRLFL